MMLFFYLIIQAITFMVLVFEVSLNTDLLSYFLEIELEIISIMLNASQTIVFIIDFHYK